MRDIERFETIVIGGGQAGLATGYHLARRGLPFVILDAHERIGDAWRKRWDSLRLFTPARLDALPGMPFPVQGHYFPTKDEMGDYLEAYAKRFDLPVRTSTRVDCLTREGDRYVVTSGDQRFEAENVIVAMADYQRPKVPAFASELDPDIVQLHIADYRNLSQLRDGGVLVVGAGNSGAEVALEAVKAGRQTWLAGRHPGQIPFRIEGLKGRLLMPIVGRVFFHRLATERTPIGRKLRHKMHTQGAPLVRIKRSDIVAAGVECAPRVAGVQDGRPVLEDGRVLDVANVVWCTGFHPGFSWIDLPVFGEDGRVRHERGVVTDQPGLYFVGQTFIYAGSSSMIHGVERDADYIAKQVAKRTRSAERRVAEPVRA